jgi:tetratricopeptide (TPR) repeat protein
MDTNQIVAYKMMQYFSQGGFQHGRFYRRDRRDILTEHEEMRKHWNQTWSDPNMCPVTNYAPSDHFSIAPLRDLVPITLKEMKKEGVYRGTCLLLQNVGDSFKAVGISMIGEDIDGNVEKVSLYHWIPQSWQFGTKLTCSNFFPVGMKFVIKEPFYKKSLDGHSLIRVDSPSDFITLYQNDPLIKNLVFPTKIKRLSDVNDIKMKANKYFQSNDYLSALYWYSYALDLDPTNSVIWCNQALCNLQLKRWTNALRDAVTGLKIDSANVKLHFRKGKALYHLGQYESAIEAFTDAKHAHTDKVNDLDGIMDEIQSCHRRVEESKGNFNLDLLWGVGVKEISLVDCAEFVHASIKIESIKGKGVGIVAKEPIEAGTLVVVSHAFAIVFGKDKGIGWNEDSDSMQLSGSDESLLLHQVVNKLCFEPSTIDFFTLYDKVTRLSSLEARRDCQDFSIQRIEGIVKVNSFGVTEQFLKGTRNFDRLQAEKETGNGLWIYPSYFNHSCNYNCVWLNRGDIMMIRTAKSIKIGEELTIPYVGNTPLAQRITALKSKDFVCKCENCIDEKSDLMQGGIEILMEKCTKMAKQGGSVSEWEKMFQMGERYKHGTIRWMCAIQLIIHGNMQVKKKYSKYILDDTQISTDSLESIVLLSVKLKQSNAHDLAKLFVQKADQMHKILFGDSPKLKKCMMDKYTK